MDFKVIKTVYMTCRGSCGREFMVRHLSQNTKKCRQCSRTGAKKTIKRED